MDVRRAVLGDAAAIARVQVATWRATYRGIVPDAFLDAIPEEAWAARRLRDLGRPGTVALVAVGAGPDGEVVGFAMGGPNRGQEPRYGGEIAAIYVLPAAQGAGLGRRLLEGVASLLREDGRSGVLVWVLARNPARAFYEALGGEPAGTKTVEIGGRALEEVAYGWGPASPLGTYPVRIVPPDPGWAAAFEREAAALRDALGGDAVAIEHVGSTAVPGLAAKPILDVLVGAHAVPLGAASVAALGRLGYEDRGDGNVPGRHYFRKGWPRTHHLHVCVHGGEFWRVHRAFRDRLRADPALVRAYEALKRRLAEAYGADRIGYTDAKTAFIEAALRGA